MVELNEVTARYELIGGYHYQGTTERILLGLGFQAEDFHKKTDTFSGGMADAYRVGEAAFARK